MNTVHPNMHDWRLRAATAAALFLATASAPAVSDADEDVDGVDDVEIPLDEAELFFELNNTDGDLGLHAVIDADEWRTLTIEGPGDHTLLAVRTRGMLRRQGLTEFNFESAEPAFDELDPAEFLARFPEGIYDIEAITLDGEELESEVEISHVLPAPPEIVSPAMTPCDDPVDVPAGQVTLDWNAVVTSHPTIGTPGQPVELERYEVALERPGSELELFIELPPDLTSFEVPAIFLTPGVVKFEILARAGNGNRTAEESCFMVP